MSMRARMQSGPKPHRWSRRGNVPEEQGVTLVDVMVALAVAMLTMVLVYATFALAQSARRSAASAADLQANGAFALSTLSIHAANAGAGLASATRWLDSCAAGTDVATTLRPINLLITDGGAPDRPDSLVVRQSLARTAGVIAAFVAEAPSDAPFRIAAVEGYAPGDRVIAISRTGQCASATVTTVATSTPGVLDIAHSPIGIALPVTSVLLNLGPATRAAAMRLDVGGGSLRSTDLTNGDAPNPLVANLVNVKFQYGIDSDGDGAVDTWVAATEGGPWSSAALMTAPRDALERIQAIRIGVIIRSERVESAQTRAFHWVLFDCELDDKTACPGRIEGTIAAAPGGGYRHRAYETVVPLRNTRWNRGA